MLFNRKVSAETAFGPGPTDKERAEKTANQAKRIAETKDAARKLCATEEFKEFKKIYLNGREAIVDAFKLMDEKDHANMIGAQKYLIVMDDLLAIERKAE